MIFSLCLDKRCIKTVDESIVTLNKLQETSSKVQLMEQQLLRGKHLDQQTMNFASTHTAFYVANKLWLGIRGKVLM